MDSVTVPRRSPWTAYALERVERGPVTYERLIAETMAKVPPGKAYRAALGEIESGRQRHGRSERMYLDEDKIRDRRIRYGKRTMARHAVQNLVKSGRVETYEDGGVEMVRLGSRTDADSFLRPTLMTEWTKAFLRAAAVGPVPLEPLYDAFTYLVPREQAITKAQHDRALARQKHQAISDRRPRRSPTTEAFDYRTGARRFLAKSVLDLSKSGRIVQSGEGDQRTIARGPRWFDPDGTS